MRRIDLRKAQAARSSTIRDINRQIVLNYVREREPISRAEIARETALQRSTVSTIVENLKSEGLIEEVGAGKSTGGRRPTMLRLRAAGAISVGVDITPSCTTVVTSDLVGRVLERDEFENTERPEEMLKRVIRRVKSFAAGAERGRVAGVGVSLPGLVDNVEGTAIYIPWFQWRDWRIAEEISRATGLEVAVDNDANAAAMAELWFGRPEVSGARDFIQVLVNEGIGTGIVFDGQIYRGEGGAAGEFGHMIVGERGHVACSCGNFDCWESFSSERAAVAHYEKLSGSGGRAAKRKAEFPDIVERALAGEQAARTVLDEMAHFLGVGISNLIVGLSPAAVIVSGHISRAWPLVGDALGETVQRSIRRGLPSARIAHSTLGGQPTLMGAISLVLARKFGLSKV